MKNAWVSNINILTFLLGIRFRQNNRYRITENYVHRELRLWNAVSFIQMFVSRNGWAYSLMIVDHDRCMWPPQGRSAHFPMFLCEELLWTKNSIFESLTDSHVLRACTLSVLVLLYMCVPCYIISCWANFNYIQYLRIDACPASSNFLALEIDAFHMGLILLRTAPRVLSKCQQFMENIFLNEALRVTSSEMQCVALWRPKIEINFF